jgi:hypothetical protein
LIFKYRISECLSSLIKGHITKPIPIRASQVKSHGKRVFMFDWISKIFKSKPNEIVTPFGEPKKQSDDDFMTQALIFPSASQALRPNICSDHSDEGTSDGGSSAGH